jgi:hypothetical protein
MCKFGELLRIRKGKYFAGISKIQLGRKALQRIQYTALFYDPKEKVLGFIGSNKPFTFSKTTHTKGAMKRFLNENGYTDFIIE